MEGEMRKMKKDKCHLNLVITLSCESRKLWQNFSTHWRCSVCRHTEVANVLEREPSCFASSAWKLFTRDLLSVLSLSSLAGNNKTDKMKWVILTNHAAEVIKSLPIFWNKEAFSWIDFSKSARKTHAWWASAFSVNIRFQN